jgi:transcriptional regulator with XRE-family HTH domain
MKVHIHRWNVRPEDEGLAAFDERIRGEVDDPSLLARIELRGALGRLLANLRRKLGWTQQRLAHAAGWKRPQVAALERADDRSMQLETLQRYLTATDAEACLVVRDSEGEIHVLSLDTSGAPASEGSLGDLLGRNLSHGSPETVEPSEVAHRPRAREAGAGGPSSYEREEASAGDDDGDDIPPFLRRVPGGEGKRDAPGAKKPRPQKARGGPSDGD